MKLAIAIALLALSLAGPSTTSGQPACSCAGDCNQDCSVSEDELAVSIAAVFSPSALGTCPNADGDGDGRVTAADVAAIQRGRIEPQAPCVAPPTATPTATATETPPATATFTATLSPTRTPTQTTIPTPASRWISLPPLPTERQEVAVAHLDGRIYVIGGFTADRSESAVVEAYDIAAGQWTDIAPLPEPGHHMGAAAVGGYVYAVGGWRNGFRPFDDVYRYDPDLDQWDEVAPLPERRGAMAVAALDGRIHAVAGGIASAVRSHTAYLPNEDRWIELRDYPIAREHIAAATVDGALYVVGGRSPITASAYRWDHSAGEWIALPPMITGRAGHAAAALAGRLVTFGGEGNRGRPGGIFPQVEVYDPAARGWTQLDDMAAPRHGIGAVTVGNRIYVPGGADVQGFGTVPTHDALEIDF